MSINLVKLLEEKMHHQFLETVDPNTQAIGDEYKQSAYALYERAIMASVLVGVFQFSRDESNMQEILSAQDLTAYPDRIFDQNFPQLEEKIIQYAGYEGDARKQFTQTLGSLVEIVRSEVGIDGAAAKDLFSAERSNILSYIPGDLEAGKILDNGTLDDRTNKMHGPFSDFTHWMEQLFSKSDK